MRINRYVALATGISRRKADELIEQGRVAMNGSNANLGATVSDTDNVTLDNRAITTPVNSITIILNKPVGYVCSRLAQGNKTIYDLLPQEMHQLKPVGRLDKDSSGLILMTNDGELANRLTHPRYNKEKVYLVGLDRALTADAVTKVKHGVILEDGISKLRLQPRNDQSSTLHSSVCEVRLSEGRNRQIRRTFAKLGYTVTKLHRTELGDYVIGDLKPGKFLYV